VRQGYQWLAGWTKFVVELRGAKIVRFHVGGDVFADWYWQYIKRLTAEHPRVAFYLYTRSFPIVAASPDQQSRQEPHKPRGSRNRMKGEGMGDLTWPYCAEQIND